MPGGFTGKTVQLLLDLETEVTHRLGKLREDFPEGSPMIKLLRKNSVFGRNLVTVNR